MCPSSSCLPHHSAAELIFKTRLFLFLGGQVAKLFQDSSLGNIVNILVTRLILLTEDQVSWALLSCLHCAAALPLGSCVLPLDVTLGNPPTPCTLLGAPCALKGSWELVSSCEKMGL